MINCDDKRLQMHIDGELGKFEIQILMEHLCSCTNCRREMNLLKVMDWDLRHRVPEDVPHALKTLRMEVLDNCFATARAAEEKVFGASDFLRIQMAAMKTSASFLRFFPGVSRIQGAVRRKPKKKRLSLARTLLARVSSL